jgi:hypothetical protein
MTANASVEELFNRHLQWFREQIHGNGALRASPKAFFSALATFNQIAWQDLNYDGTLSRLERFGLIFAWVCPPQPGSLPGRPGIMFVIPSQVASFFGVSKNFVTKHLHQSGWDIDDVSMRDAAEIRQTFPPVLLESKFANSPDIQLRFLRPAEPTPEIPKPGLTTPDDEERDLSTLTDQQADDLVLDDTADALAEAVFPEMEDLDLALDGTLELLQSVVSDPLGPVDQESPPDADVVFADPDRAFLERAATDSRIPILRACLADLRGQLKEIKKSRDSLKLRLGRACRTISSLRRQNADLKLQIPTKGTLAPPPAPPDPPTARPPLQKWFLSELLALAVKRPATRSFSDDMKSICYALYTVSPQAYRFARQILPLPSATTLSSFMSDEKQFLGLALAGGRESARYLQEYRQKLRLGDNPVPSVLAFDATAANATGVKLDKNAPNACMTYIILPLDHRLPDLVLRSYLGQNGRIGDEALKVKDKCVQAMTRAKFVCHFVATDSDAGTNPLHTEAFARYLKSSGLLEDIIDLLTDHGLKDLIEWPISDFFHLLKNVRARLATSKLSLDADAMIFLTALSVAASLKSDPMRKILCAHSSLDFLKDHLALATFTLENLLKLWSAGDADAAYFLLPFVALNLAVRNSEMTVDTRKGLIQIAFTVFFEMALNYPETGREHGIYARCGPHTIKTFWTIGMLKRACNYCVGVYWALCKWGLSQEFWLALARIGSHPVECNFGMTRATLNGDPSWKRFFAAQVNAALVRRVMWNFNIRPYIRRFRNEAGCTLGPGRQGRISVDFTAFADFVLQAVGMLRNNERQELLSLDVTILTPFQVLSDELAKCKYVEKIRKASDFSGHSITGRFIWLHGPNGGKRKRDGNVVGPNLDGYDEDDAEAEK